MTQETFAQATILKNKMRECEKLKETLMDPKMHIAETSAALARYFLTHPEDILGYLDEKLAALQEEFDMLGRCPICEGADSEKPQEPSESEGGDDEKEGDYENNKEDEDTQETEGDDKGEKGGADEDTSSLEDTTDLQTQT